MNNYNIKADIRLDQFGVEKLYYKNEKFTKHRDANQKGEQRWICSKKSSERCMAVCSTKTIHGNVMMKIINEQHSHEGASYDPIIVNPFVDSQDKCDDQMMDVDNQEEENRDASQDPFFDCSFDYASYNDEHDEQKEKFDSVSSESIKRSLEYLNSKCCIIIASLKSYQTNDLDTTQTIINLVNVMMNQKCAYQIPVPGSSRVKNMKSVCRLLCIIQSILVAIGKDVLVSLNSIYYRNKLLFRSNKNASCSIVHLSKIFGKLPWEFRVEVTARSFCFSNKIFLKINKKYRQIDGAVNYKMLNKEIKVEGSLLPSILVVEKKSVYDVLNYMIEKNQLNIVLFTGSGNADLVGRVFLNQISNLVEGMPAYALTDNHPHGLSIYLTYRDGSQRWAHRKTDLTLPHIKRIGLAAEDCEKHNISMDKLKDAELIFLNALSGRLTDDDPLMEEVKIMLTTKKTASLNKLTDISECKIVEFLREKMNL